MTHSEKPLSLIGSVEALAGDEHFESKGVYL